MSSLTIHIGYPKTGTSFLQRHAFPELHRCGLVNYVATKPLANIRNYIVATDGFSYSPEYVREQIAPLLSTGPNLISCEAFTGSVFYKAVNNYEIARRLSLTFPEAKILISIREQVSLVHSLYRQYVHEGGHLSLRKFLNFKDNQFSPTYYLDDHRFNLECLRFDRLIASYRELFSPEKVAVVLFEDFVKSNRDFVARLVPLVTEKTSASELEMNDARENPGFGRNQIFISRMLSPLIRSHFNRSGFLPINLRFRLLLQSRLSFWLLGKKRKPSPEIDAALQDYFRSGNQALLALVSEEIPEEFRAAYDF